MPQIQSKIDPRSESFAANEKAMRALIDELHQNVDRVAEGGGPRYAERHKARGKLRSVVEQAPRNVEALRWLLAIAPEKERDGLRDRLVKLAARRPQDPVPGVTHGPIEQVDCDSENAGRTRVRVPSVPFSILVDADGFAVEELGPFEPDEAPATLELESMQLVRRR